MERVETPCLVVLKDGTGRKVSVEICDTGFALVKNWTSENRSAGDVQYHLGQALSLLEKTVCLKPRDRGQSVNRVGFRYCHHVIRHWIDAKFALVEILHDEGIT